MKIKQGLYKSSKSTRIPELWYKTCFGTVEILQSEIFGAERPTRANFAELSFNKFLRLLSAFRRFVDNI
jgi:hypothetical protein